MKQKVYSTEFVDRMPEKEDMVNGIVYVAPHFECVLHKCMCGCGEVISTPITQGQWSWEFDGRNICLTPSIGNFSYPCKSHYFLKNGVVIWC